MDYGSSAPGELAKEFALWLTVFRVKAHLSPDELAERAGLGVDEIRKLESARFHREPRMETYRLLVAALGLDQPERAADRRLLDNAYVALVAAHHPYAQRLRAMWRAIDRPIADWPPATRILVLSSLAVAIALTLILRGAPTAPIPPTASRGALPAVSAADLRGWTVSVEQADPTSTLLLVSDAHTKQSYTLLPSTGSLPVEGEELLDPHYLPTAGAIAYIRVWHHTRSLWLATLSFHEHHLQILPPGPRELVANCGSCNTLTWAASGDWILYDGAEGLLAVSPHTGLTHQITQGAHDAWPSCAPNGQWLVYQHAVETEGYLVVVPARNCLPTPDASEHMRLIAGPVLGWHPDVSPDGRFVTFTASPGGSGPHAWQVYLAPLNASTSSSTATMGQATAISPISPRGCADPTWASDNGAPGAGSKEGIVYTCGDRLFMTPARASQAPQAA